MAPSTMRGRRTSQTMFSRPEDQSATTLPGISWEATTRQTVSSGMGTAPAPTAIAMTATSRTADPMIMAGVQWIAAWRRPVTR